MNNGFVHAITIAPIEYGDEAAIEWKGGQYSIWLGGTLSLTTWSEYAARLMVQADRMMLAAGMTNIDPTMGMGAFNAGTTMSQREMTQPVASNNDGVQRTVKCIGLPYHKGVGCTMYVSSRTQLNFTRAYMVHLGVVKNLNITTMNNGFVHAITIAPIEYGDGAAIEWNGGQYSIWLGGTLSLATWSEYAARLMVQADRMMQEAGITNIDPTIGAGALSAGPPMSFGAPTGSCSIIQQEIQMAMEDIRSSQNTKSGMEERGSIWTSGMAGVVTQNQQRLQDLQEQLSHCSN
jgi:hypothetical protein